MEITVRAADLLQELVALLALPLWEGDPLPAALAALPDTADWTAGARQTLLVYPRGALPAERVLLIGLGPAAKADTERLREAGALAVQRARDLKLARVDLAFPATHTLAPEAAAAALAEGATLGTYSFLRYKSDQKPAIAVSELWVAASGDLAPLVRGAAVGAATGRGVALARDLANTPANDLPPAALADAAVALGSRFNMQTLVLTLPELSEQGFGGIIAVGQGSANEPRFIVLEHGQKRDDAPTICLVGKGITFDSGGISIKPAEGMDQMKFDMGGAAAVLGAMQTVGELDLPLHVVALIASAENMLSSTAYRPGDIVTTLSGKTIEVLNTDAEGRIVLADALFYAQRYAPAAIIDLATLTGAIMVALGPHAIGMMSNDDALAERLARAGTAAGDPAWRMPLTDPYREMVKSEIADIKNSTGRFGGAITAAAFLEHFVGGMPWAHLDIAGTGWVDRQTKPFVQRGATGAGVRLLVAALLQWAEA